MVATTLRPQDFIELLRNATLLKALGARTLGGLVGNADIIVAAEGTRFGLPEVNQGALGAATHLARLVPQHKMREMVYTAEPVDVSVLHAYGSVSRVVPAAPPRMPTMSGAAISDTQ